MVHFHVQSLMDKAQSDDPDLRFMALTDLISETSSLKFSLDEPTEIKCMEMVLRLMEDSNGEVKNAGIKALASLSPRLRKAQISKVIDQLIVMSSGGASKGEELRDVASLALKTVTFGIAPESSIAPSVVDKLPLKLLSQLDAASLPPQQTLETLDILTDLFTRFHTLILAHREIQKEALRVLVGLLSTGRLAVKKKAIIALGALVSCSSPKIFTSLSQTLVSTLGSSDTPKEVARAYVQLVGTLSKSASQKTGEVLKDVMPVIIASCGEDEEDETREVGLQTLESLVLRCPTETTPFISQIMDVSIESVAYDPNYAGGDDDDEEMEDAEDEDEDDEDLDEEYEDDEDQTWKVRRSSAKVLSAIVSTRSELLTAFFKTLSPTLIARIAEREESVRLEIFATLSTLLKQTLVFGRPAETFLLDDGSMTPRTLKRKREETEEATRRTGNMPDVAMAVVDESEDTPVRLLRSQLPSILKQVLKQLNTKSLPTKQSGFTLLRDLSAVLSGGLDAQASVICTRVSDTLSSHGHHTSSPLIIEALRFLGQFFANHPSKVWEKELGRLVPQVVSLTKDKNQKTSVEAFVVISELAKSIRPSRNQPLDGGLAKFVEAPYKATVEVLQGSLADVEVRIKAIETLADLLSYEGDVLSADYETCLGVLSNSVGNETLRVSAIKAIGEVAGAQLCQGEVFGRWLVDSLGTVTGVLRKGSRSVRTVSFECLSSILTRLASEIPSASATSLISDLSPFIAAEDLQNFPLTLNLLTLLLRTQPAAKPFLEALLPTIYTITRSPVLVGPALDAVLGFFAGLVSLESAAGLRIIQDLIKPFEAVNTIPDATSGELHAFRTVAKCVGAVVKAGQANAAGVVAEFAKQIESKNDATAFLALLCLGEIGRSVDMSAHQATFDRILSLFHASHEEVQEAAAFAAGNFAVGSPSYLPAIVALVESTDSSKAIRLLSLHALREAIFHCSRAQLETIADSLWVPLFEDSKEAKDEDNRMVVALCIGKLTTCNPGKYLPQLQTRIQSSSAKTRATVASAVRYTFTDTDASYDDVLAPIIVEFLQLMQDPDLTVRRLSLGSLNAAASNKPQLIREHLPTLLPLLYSETEVKKELLREVQMGPWKQIFDDGLETRKTAYETMYALLDTCLSRLDIPTYLARVVAGLADAPEIKVLSFLALSRLSLVAPTSITQILDSIAPLFAETMKAFVPGKDSVKQDYDRHAEMQRSALRTIVSLSKLSSAGASPAFEALVVATKRGEFSREWNELDH